MDTVTQTALMSCAMNAVVIPIVVAVVKRAVVNKLDDFDRKRDDATAERKRRLDAEEFWQNGVTIGLQAVLRNDLEDKHETWTQRGYCPISEKDKIEELWRAYHVALGGNGTGESMYHEVMALPTKKKETDQ